MAVTLKGQTAVYEGVSTDTKPTDADNNAIFKELDTGIRYYYDGTDWNEIPSSGGGGTGTDNYNELNNKPSINGTVLSGNKSLDNLGIQKKLTFDSAPTEDSENPVESGGVYSALAGKQDTISDLSAIRSGADAGATAVQPTELETALAQKQDALSSEQLDAVNSGITSADVEQITTNKNNILSLNKYGGGKNKFNIDTATINVSDASYTKNSDGTINVTKSTNTIGQVNMQQAFLGETGMYIISGCPSGGSSTTYEMLIQSGNTVLARDYGEGASVSLTKGTEYQFKVVVRENQTLSNKLFKPMISVDGEDYQPYALSNASLTSENEINKNNISYIERMNGKKNFCNVNITSQTVGTLTFTVNTNKTIVVNGTKPSPVVSIVISESIQLPAGDYVLLDGTGSSSDALNITLFKGTSSWVGTTATGGKLEFTANGIDTYFCKIYVNQAVDNVLFKPMIITKSAYDAGFTDYQPYALPNTTITPALKECVDNGAKNKFNPNGTPSSANMVYNGDGTYTVTKTTTGVVVFMFDTFRIDAGTYILSGCPANGGASTIIVDIRTDDGTVIGEQDLGTGATVTIPTTGTYRLSVRFGSNYTASGLVIKPMLCDPALWTISPTFEPYAMSNAELTNDISSLAALRTYRLPTNDTSYSFASLDGIDDTTRFKYALIVGGGTAATPTNALVWLLFISTDGECTITKIIGNGAQVLTGAVSGTTLNITASAIIYGGLRLIWLG